MAIPSHASLPDVSRRVLRLRAFTILWMSKTGLRAFQADPREIAASNPGEARAARITGALLFALAGFLALASVLNFLGYREAHRQGVGLTA